MLELETGQKTDWDGETMLLAVYLDFEAPMVPAR